MGLFAVLFPCFRSMVDHQEMDVSSVESSAKTSLQGEIVRQPDPSTVEIKAVVETIEDVPQQQPASTSTPPAVVQDEKQTAPQPAREEVATVTLQLPDLVFLSETQVDPEQSPKSDSSSQDDTLIEKTIEESPPHDVIEPTKTNETTVAGSVNTEELHQNETKEDFTQHDGETSPAETSPVETSTAEEGDGKPISTEEPSDSPAPLSPTDDIQQKTKPVKRSLSYAQPRSVTRRMSLARLFTKRRSVMPELPIPQSPGSHHSHISPISPSSSKISELSPMNEKSLDAHLALRVGGRRWQEDADTDSLYCY